MQVPQRLDEALVIQTKTGELLDHLHIAHLADRLIIAPAQEIHQAVFFAAGLFGNDDFVPVFPFLDQAGNHLHRILEVGTQRNGAVTAGMDQAIVRAVELTEVFGVEDGANLFVLGADAADDVPGLILAFVVNEKDFIVILRQALLQFGTHRLVDGAGVFLLIVTGNHDGDFLFVGVHCAVLLIQSMVFRMPCANSVAGTKPVSCCRAEISACRCITCSGP